ncbi:MAG: cyclic pyranopterin monophosphate synthase MoaC [Myxococcota bacterium]|nr:cyclic pyranopterin monophosphate synthase MoaC [Myxococcota bacterium]
MTSRDQGRGGARPENAASAERDPAPLTHLDAQGRARMVDVGEKPVTHRLAVAQGEVHMRPETLSRIVEGTVAKGDVLATARIAGIQAAKKTSDWIPLAHPLPLDAVEVSLTPDPERALLRVQAQVQTHWRTGVEMEALVAVSAAALTVYDMCKAIDRGMHVESVGLLRKRGGRSGDFDRDDP